MKGEVGLSRRKVLEKSLNCRLHSTFNNGFLLQASLTFLMPKSS